jgi:hypothetical protein
MQNGKLTCDTLIVDLKPCKGIKVGDIGPKAYGGFATTDNGCKFKA